MRIEPSVKIGKTADELLEERVQRALKVFTREQILHWETLARMHAESNTYLPPSAADLILGVDVYMRAFNRRRYKIAKDKREQSDIQHRT